MRSSDKPLTNVQLELLKVFSYDLPDEDLQDLKKVMANFFAQRAIKAADEVWEKEGWNEEKVEELLNTKLRARKS